MKVLLSAICTMLVAAIAAQAEVGTIAIATANTYSFAPAAGNLIGGLSPSAVVNGGAGQEGTGTFVKLTDGAIIADKPNTYTVGNNAVITYTLGEAEDGYDITGVNLYSGWSDTGRENITVTSLAYSTPGDPTTFVAIPGTAVNYSGGTSIAVARYTAAGGPIAEGVYALRINFGPQENNYVGYREIEFIGAASAPLVAPPEIVTLSATNVTLSSAWINGSLTSTGSAATAVMAYWGATDGGTNAAAWANSTTWAAPQVPGEFTHPVSGLSADAVYYCRFAASNAVGVAWSEATMTFITGEVTLQKIVDAVEATLAPGAFRFSRPATTLGAPLTVYYEQTGGTAVSGKDFQPLSGSVVIPSGAETADIAVMPIVNWSVLTDTTVELALQTGGYLLGSPSLATMTITNAAPPSGNNVWIASSAGNASVASNWSLNRVPEAGDHILLGGYSAANLTWDAAATNVVASWTQTADYTGTVTFQTAYGTTGFTNMTIIGATTVERGAWTHAANAGTEAYRLAVTVGGDFVLGATASILADGKGYTSARGPGAGTGWVDGSASATHGGVGGDSGHRASRNTYGSVEAPVNLGSASGNPGGGAILLTVSGAATIGGVISANGGSGTYGCGSGGSVFITAGALAGAGILRANGGVGGYSSGGGGRIALVLTGAAGDFASWTGVETAYGATGGGRSGAGTVYRRSGSGEDWLIVDNNNYGMGLDNITLMPAGVNLGDYSHIVVRNKGVLGVRADTALDFGAFNIAPVDAANSFVAIIGDGAVTYPANWILEGYTLRGEGISKPLQNVTIRNGGVLSSTASLNATVRTLTLNIAGDLTVEATGSIGLDGAGYASGNGPGASPSSGQDGGAGGTHGGIGGEATTKLASKNTYGSILAPMLPGSASGGYGGGAAVLAVGGTTTVAGSISANGAGNTYGSGAGGSVFLTTANLAGGGVIRANGGNGGASSGGGGRIAIVLAQGGFSGWTGAVSATGDIGGYDSAAGTIYLAEAGTPPGYGAVVIDNKNIAKNTTYTPMPAFAASTEDLKHTQWLVRNKGSVKLVADARVLSLVMQNASYLDLAGKRLVVDMMTINGDNVPSGEYAATAPEIGTGYVSDSVGGGALVVRGRATLLIVR